MKYIVNQIILEKIVKRIRHDSLISYSVYDVKKIAFNVSTIDVEMTDKNIYYLYPSLIWG